MTKITTRAELADDAHSQQYDYDNAHHVFDGKGKVVVPGFIDGHLHIESSLMHPFEFERLTLPLGTTTAICDPHEITNVMGDEGFSRHNN